MLHIFDQSTGACWNGQRHAGPIDERHIIKEDPNERKEVKKVVREGYAKIAKKEVHAVSCNILLRKWKQAIAETSAER